MNCPICKSEPIIDTRLKVGKALMDDEISTSPQFMVYCEFCEFMETSWYETEKEAWEEWQQLCEEPNK